MVQNNFAQLIQYDGRLVITPVNKELKLNENDAILLLTLYTWLLGRGVR